MASLTQWTWVWENSRSRWWTGKPGVLQSLGGQGVRHNWANEQQHLVGKPPLRSTIPPSSPAVFCSGPYRLSLIGHVCACVLCANSLQSCLTLQPTRLQPTRLLCPSPTPRACSNSGPWSRQCHPTISSSVIPFSSCLQPFPASGAFPMSQFFTSDGQGIVVLASASVLRMNIQDWFPLEWTGLIPLQSKGLSKAFSNTIVQKHQFFRAQLALWSITHIHKWLLEKS